MTPGSRNYLTRRNETHPIKANILRVWDANWIRRYRYHVHIMRLLSSIQFFPDILFLHKWIWFAIYWKETDQNLGQNKEESIYTPKIFKVWERDIFRPFKSFMKIKLILINKGGSWWRSIIFLEYYFEFNNGEVNIYLLSSI